MKAETHDENGWQLTIDLAHADLARLAADEGGEPLRGLVEPVEAEW